MSFQSCSHYIAFLEGKLNATTNITNNSTDNLFNTSNATDHHSINNNNSNNATLGSIPVLDGYFFAYLTLFAFGFVFNFATLITLSHSSLREWSTRVFLAALSIIDIVALLLTFLLVLQDYRIVILAGKKSCKFFA